MNARLLETGFDPVGGLGGIGAIARGCGRSYGDAAHISGGLVIATDRLSGISLDVASGALAVEAGVTLGKILAECGPRGWTLPVVPGTQHVSVGGAIASDVHGKNHLVSGSFGDHVQSLTLLTSAGNTVEVGPASQRDLFDATLGGMGLTGIVLHARLQMIPMDGPMMSVDTDRTCSLDDAFALLSGPGGAHRVAWLDLLTPGPVRGITTRSEHTPTAGGPATSLITKAHVTIPSCWPGSLMRPAVMRAYNAARYQRAPRKERGRLMSFGQNMFPLDAVGAWPHLYGRHGLCQYQFVVPTGQELVLERVLQNLRSVKVPCYLAVLKRMGAASPRPLSFALDGWSLALDFPAAATGLSEALDRCDELVAANGGRVYLTKDMRLRRDTVAAMYPRLPEWRSIRDAIDPTGLWRSDLGVRTGLVGGN